VPSDRRLAFFEYCGPGSPAATEMCKCGYHAAAHSKDTDYARRVVCRNFTPQGAHEMDRYYCGCFGWD